MPDLDRFERTFKVGGWRGAYRRAREAVASTEEVGDKLVKALAKTLRTNMGVPKLPAIADIVETLKRDFASEAVQCLGCHSTGSRWTSPHQNRC